MKWFINKCVQRYDDNTSVELKNAVPRNTSVLFSSTISFSLLDGGWIFGPLIKQHLPNWGPESLARHNKRSMKPGTQDNEHF